MEKLDVEKILSQLSEALKGADSPCTDCLQNAQNAYAICMANAKTPAQQAACASNLQNAVVNCNNGPCRKP